MNNCPNCNEKVPLFDKVFKVYFNDYKCRFCKCDLKLSKFINIHFLLMVFLMLLIYRYFIDSHGFFLLQAFNALFFLLHVLLSRPIRVI